MTDNEPTTWRQRATEVVAAHVHAEAHVSADDAEAFARFLIQGEQSTPPSGSSGVSDA